MVALLLVVRLLGQIVVGVVVVLVVLVVTQQELQVAQVETA
jgi:hypothetical protein